MVAVLVVLAGLGSYGQQAVAAEIGYIRVGDDYKFSKVPRGKGYKWCERQCRKDDKCKSWTYLRPSRQCRLKSDVAPKFKNDCCVSGEKKAKEEVGSRQKQCRNYANKAITDYESNSLVENCGFSGRKWTDDFAEHFDFCTDATAEERRKRRRERKRDLEQCKKEAGSDDNREETGAGRLNCRQYARKSLKQQETNIENKCGFNNKLRWQSSLKYYRNWCRDNSSRVREEQDKLRQVAIARCLKRGGGEFVKLCDDHAQASLKQVSAASENGCGFRDRGKWSSRL